MLESSPAKVSLPGGEVTLVPLDQLRTRLAGTQASAIDLRTRAQALVAQAQQELAALEQPQAATALLRDWLLYDK